MNVEQADGSTIEIYRGILWADSDEPAHEIVFRPYWTTWLSYACHYANAGCISTPQHQVHRAVYRARIPIETAVYYRQGASSDELRLVPASAERLNLLPAEIKMLAENRSSKDAARRYLTANYEQRCAFVAEFAADREKELIRQRAAHVLDMKARAEERKEFHFYRFGAGRGFKAVAHRDLIRRK